MAEIRDCALNTRISCNLKEALEKAAVRDGRTLSNYIEQILLAHVEKVAKRRAR